MSCFGCVFPPVPSLSGRNTNFTGYLFVTIFQTSPKFQTYPTVARGFSLNSWRVTSVTWPSKRARTTRDTSGNSISESFAPIQPSHGLQMTNSTVAPSKRLQLLYRCAKMYTGGVNIVHFGYSQWNDKILRETIKISDEYRLTTELNETNVR